MKKILIYAFLSLIVLTASLGFYVFFLLEQIPRAEDLPFVEVKEEVIEPQVQEEQSGDIDTGSDAVQDTENAEIRETGTINILLIGRDEVHEQSHGRSDSILMGSIDKNHGKLKLVSFMRDMYLPIPGHRSNRLNAAFAFGGAPLLMRTISENFNVSTERFVIVDFEGFEAIIDIVGGIELNITNAEYQILRNSVNLEGQGLQTLNGKQALAYSRLRSIGRSDFDRVERQQIVLTTLFEKISSTSIFRLSTVLSSILPHITTNMSSFDILNLGTQALRVRDRTIHRFRLPAENSYKPVSIRGMSVLQPDMELNKQLLHEFLYQN